MSKQVSITTSATLTISQFVSGSYQGITGQTNPVGVGTSNTSSYATVNLRTGASAKTYAFWKFDCSSIPTDATINSVSCAVRAYVSNSNSNRVNTKQVNLYSGTTTAATKGTAQTVTTASTGSVLTIPGGTWTRSQLNNCYLGLYGVRGTSQQYTATTYYFRLYGAELSVNYTASGTAYEFVAVSNITGATITPATAETFAGESQTFTIELDDGVDLNDLVVEDNEIDVTSELEYVVPSTTYEFTGTPASYDSANSTYDGIYTGSTNSGLSDHNSNDRICCYANTASGSTSKLTYNFNCSSIPENATITSVSCIAAASCYSSGQYFDTKTIQLYSGTVAKGSPTTITGNGSTKANHTIDGGSWTRQELNNAKIVLYIVRGNNTTQASFSFWGATLTINYTLPENPYYEYTLTGVTDDHDIVVRENVIVPPEEDPQKEYYSLTISSINATTTPNKGTTRVESGTTEVVTIYPFDPQLTLATDNGVDITSQLVSHAAGQPTTSVTTVQGASYGFAYSSGTGYYVSQNKGTSRSAALCKVAFNLPVRCLITIQYINYAEATYDFGVFGNVDTPLSTDYYAAGSGGATITDSDYKLACNTSAYNTSSVQSITYEIPSGEHYIYVKYSKDDATDSNNDTLQFKISSIEMLETNNYYTYTLSSISTGHSLVFIFGNVSYYFINSSTNNEDVRLYPQGTMVQLPGDNYKLTVVPPNATDVVSVYDNNTDVTSNLERKEITTEKDGVTTTTVNYIYTLYNIQAAHNIVAQVSSAGDSSYLKVNGEWEGVKIYKKINNVWVEQTPSSEIFDSSTIYLNG